jgi:hypothetical protein
MPPKKRDAPRLTSKERRQLKHMARIQKIMQRRGPGMREKVMQVLLSFLMISALVFIIALIVTLAMHAFE